MKQDINIIQFGYIFPDKEELLNILKDSKKIIDVFIKDISDIIERFKNVKENIETIYKIYFEMVTKYDDKNRNYQVFNSLNNIKNINIIMNDLNDINKINDIHDKMTNILNIYNQMFQTNQNNKINSPDNNILFDEYNLNSESIGPIKKNFPLPPLVGLEGLGNFCCINATLQCLCNIDQFVNFIKYNKELINFVKNDLQSGNKKLASSFKLLIEKIWSNDNKKKNIHLFHQKNL